MELPNDNPRITELQQQANELSAMLRHHGIAPPSNENADRAAANAPPAARMEVWMNQHVADLKNQLLYGTTE